MDSTAAAALTTPVDELLEVLSLEPSGRDSFRGRSLDQGLGKIFGGQLVAQGLSAAQQTVADGKRANSVSTQFLRPGSPARPLSLVVERLRDGRAFATRRVTVTQDSDPVCAVTASFHIDEPGFEHQQAEPPTVPAPGELLSERDIANRYLDSLPDQLRRVLPRELVDRVAGQRALELRPIEHFSDPIAPQPMEPVQHIWFRATAELPDAASVHQRVLAFASDFHFLGTSMRPHGVTVLTPGVAVASLDHTIWFHRPASCADWLLHTMESPIALGALGLSRGQWFTGAGHLVASTAQQALVRDRRRH